MSLLIDIARQGLAGFKYLERDSTTMQYDKSLMILVVILSLFAGCSTIYEQSSGEQGGEENLSVASTVTSTPKIHIEEAEVLSVQTDPRAVESVLGAGQQYQGVDVVTARVKRVRLENPDNATVPTTVTSGENITLVFLRSARPARVIERPLMTNTSSPPTNSSISASRADMDSGIQSVNITQEEVVFYTRNSSSDSQTIYQLPGLQTGDSFATTAHMRQNTFVVTTYNKK